MAVKAGRRGPVRPIQVRLGWRPFSMRLDSGLDTVYPPLVLVEKAGGLELRLRRRKEGSIGRRGR